MQKRNKTSQEAKGRVMCKSKHLRKEAGYINRPADALRVEQIEWLQNCITPAFFPMVMPCKLVHKDTVSKLAKCTISA